MFAPSIITCAVIVRGLESDEWETLVQSLKAASDNTTEKSYHALLAV